MLLIDAYRSGYNPLTAIPWSHAYYAEGPEFLALGKVNNDAVGTWPDEIGTADQAQATGANQPLYIAASNINSQPALRFDSSDRMIATWSNVSVPYTIVLLAKLASVSQGTTYVLCSGQNTVTGRHEIMTNTTPNPDQWQAYAGAALTGAGPPVADTASRLHVAEFVGSSGSVYTVDGTVIASGVTSNQVSAGLKLGRYADDVNFAAPMDLAFAAFINRALTSDEKSALRTWAQGKYATA